MTRTVLYCTFLLLGAFIGAGFISGKEVSTFFCNDNNLLLKVYLAFILFSLLIYGLFLIGKRYNTFNAFNQKNYGTCCKIISFVFGISSIISASAMLSGTESIFKEFYNINIKVPIFAMAMLLISIFVAFYGIKLLQILNFILVPIMLVGIIIISLSTKIDTSVICNEKSNIINVYLYVAMNVWFSVPLIIELGANIKKRELFIISLLTSIIIALLILIIGLGIKNNSMAINSSMPLLYLASGNKIKMVIYVIITLLAIFTTLSSSLYSMRIIFIKSDHVMQKMCILGTIILLISLLGFGSIVEYLYPIIGLLGLIYFSLSFIKIKTNLYKNQSLMQK